MTPNLPFRQLTSYDVDTNPQAPEAITGETDDITTLIPSEYQDVYQFVDMVFSVRNAVFQVPWCMTLNRFRYITYEFARVRNHPSVVALDPLRDTSDQEARELEQNIDLEAFSCFTGLLVLCVGSTLSEIRALPLGESSVCPFTDRFMYRQTAHGVLQISFRVYRPVTVTSENHRERYIRQIASLNPTLSPRVSMLLTEARVPLVLIPGITTRPALEAVADSVNIGQSWI